MKKFFSILMIICLGFTGLLLGCEGGRYDDLTITIKTEQARADDGSITLYVGEGAEDISVTMAGAPKGFNYVPSFSLSENIVKLGDVNHMLKNGVRKTIEGIAPGYTVLTAYTSEGSKTATLKINVIKKAESISYNTDYKLAVLNVAGHKTTIDTGSAISILPKDSNQNTIKYSLVTEGLSDIVSIRDNVLTTLSGIETTPLKNFTIKAEVVNHLGEVNPNVDPAYMDVRIMDNILPEDIKLYQSKNEYDSVSDAVLNNPITTTLVLSKNYNENNAMYVFIGVNTTESITVVPPPNVNSSPVMITLAGRPTRNGVKYFVFRVQAIRYSDIKTLKFTITVDGYEEFFNFSAELDVKCELYIRNFSINEQTLIDGEAHEVTLYTNDQTAGTQVKISVGNPKEILAADAKFFITMYNTATGEQISKADVDRMFIITNVSSNQHGLIEEGYLKEVTLTLKLNGTTLGVRDSGKYKLVITAEQPLAFSYKATAEVNIRIVQGISAINSITYGGETYLTEPIKINFENAGEPLEVTLNAEPESETSYETLFAESSNQTVFRVEKKAIYENTFLIYPLSVGDAEIRFGSKNLTSSLIYKVNVYEDIEDFYVSIDEFSQFSYIGTSTVEDNSLTSAVIKTSNVGVFSSAIELKLSTVPTNARFYETLFEVYNAAGEQLPAEGNIISDDYFKLNTKDKKFSIKFLSVDNFYTVKVKMLNYDGSVIEKSFVVKAYIPITKITMTLTNKTLYNPHNLGYFDLNHASKTYTKTQVTIAVNPNATYGYQSNIFYEVVANGAVTDTLLLRNGTEFTLNPDYEIKQYPLKVYLIAYALEFGKRVEAEPAIITIKDPVTVQSMAVEGDINGDILYFKLGYDNSKDIKISLTPSVNLFNSGVKWVQYAEGTTTVLDFADNGSGIMTAVDNSEAVFSVLDLGNNNFRVTALKAGNARFLLIPEDKIKDVNGSHYIYEWDKIIELFVSVADGSRRYPYHVASFKDFKDIEKAMDKFYVLTNNIAVEDNWIPLGYNTRTPLNGGINGLYSRIIDASTGERYSVQYKITDISYAVSLPSKISHYGLIYALGDGVVIEGVEDKAILENLIVSYGYLQAEFSEEFIFGGIAAINRGTIDNCQVSITNATLQLSGVNYSVGGMVGINEGGAITNKSVDNAVNVSINLELKNSAIIKAYFGGMVGQMLSGTINGYQKDYSEISWCPENHSELLTDSKICVEYCDCNAFGTVYRNGGLGTNLSKHPSTKMPMTTISEFDLLGSFFEEFLLNFTISDTLSEWKPTTTSDAYIDYTTFFEKAKGLFATSGTDVARGLDYDITKGAVIGINKPFSINFGAEDIDYDDMQEVISRLFGYNDVNTFKTYAQNLVNAYIANIHHASPATISSRLVYDGAIYTANDHFVLPYAFKNTQGDTVLAYVILDDAGRMAIWINDVAAAFTATNFANTIPDGESGDIFVYGRCKLFATSAIEITFGDQGYDVIANFNITTEQTFSSDMPTAVGGVVGYIGNSDITTVEIRDVAVQGTFRAAKLNNVGGIVGHSAGILGAENQIAVTLFNNTNNAKITGKNYVGGVVGKASNTTFDYCSAENYRETQTTIRPFITGVDYVGGFGGLLELSNISNSYVVSYFENGPDFTAADVTDTNSDIVVNSETGTSESKVGGFIASLTLTDTNVVNKIATLVNIYVSSNSKRNAGGIFGNYNGFGLVNNAICKGFASEGVSAVAGQGTAASISSSATYYSALNPTAPITSLGDILAKGNGTYDDVTVWAVNVEVNDSLPYLLDDNGNILFAFLPIEINVVVQDNRDLIPGHLDEFNNSGYIFVEGNVALIYLNELNSGELTAEQLLALNTHKITEFANLDILPLTLKTSRLVITSSNTSVVRVNQDSLIAMKEGSARITVSSKLNSDYRCEFFVIVKYGLNDYALYETSNFAPSSLVKNDPDKAITMVVDKKAALYENTKYTRTVDGTDYDLKVTNTTSVRFVLENETYKDSFTINTNWTISDKTYTDIAVSTLTTIYSKLITDGTPVKITATPFLEVTYLNTKKEIFYNHLSASFYVKVVNGADNIYFESSISQTQGIEITQLQSFVFTVIMDTDTNEDAIVGTIKDGEGNIIDDTGDYVGSVVRLQTNSGGEANIETEIDGQPVLIGKKVSYTISYEAETDEDGKVESLKEDKKFFIVFSSLLVPDVKVTLPITVKPQDIVSADIGVYSSTDDYNTSASGTTKDGTDKFIFNGSEQVALLTVEIYPDFSRFASFDIVYTSTSGFPISMTQLKYTKGASDDDDPFTDYGEGSATYVTGYGVKVDKATGGEPLLGSGTGIYSYSKIYYFSMMVGSEVPDLTTYTMTLVFYDEDKNIIEPRNISYTFQSLASPQIDLAVKDASLENNLPIGTSNELSVSTKNYTGDIAWEVSIEGNNEDDRKTGGHYCGTCGTEEIPAQYTQCLGCINEEYALLDMLIPAKNEAGKYFLNIPKDNFNLLGRFIKIKGIIEKSEGSENFTDDDDIKVYVSLYTVTDMSVDGLSADTLKLQIYTPYSLKVNLSAVYSPDVDYTLHNSNGYTIANMIARLKDEISKAAIWQAIEETGPDTLIKNGTKLYNSCYSCISYGGYYAVYGEIVDMISSISATAKVGFVGGVPTHIPIVPVDPDAPVESDNTRSRTFTRQFTLTFTYQNDIKNPIPITSAEDFLKMEEGKDYRLSTDIMLTEYTPLTTRILSLDGNGYTIYVASFAPELTLANLGLFSTVAGADGTAEATMIYNLKVHYISNVIENITYPNGETKYSYELPAPPEKYPQKTVVDATKLTEFYFGGIAGINNGIITNCSVTGIIDVQANNDSLTASHVGGLAGINNGYITNSNVTDLDLTASGNIGGVAGSNSNTISSTYTDEIHLNNVSTNTETFYTGGFVCDNQEGAKILECYTQGKRNPNDVTIVNTSEGLKTSGTAGGFVYKNLGSIEDCYSNIAITASAFSAGFVFVNGENAIVNNCYSISRVALNSKAASPFTGIGKDGGVVVTYEGQITNCFYLKDNYNNFTNEPATRITLNDFSTSDCFGTFNIKLNTSDPNEAEGYTWYIAGRNNADGSKTGGKPRLTQTDIKTYAMYDYKGKTKNYTANSEVYFKYNTDAGKWFAYNKATGYDNTKEMIITRRATLIYYIDNDVEYYFKPAYDINDNPLYGTVSGKQVRLYDVIDPARADKLYFLAGDDIMMGYNKATENPISGDVIKDEALFFTYIEETYTEEVGISANVWRDIDSGRSFYKRTADTGLYENFTTDAVNQDPVMRFVYKIDTVSVTYKDGESSSLVDLSIDSEGECDFTYILTAQEYKDKTGIENVPEPYKTYGGCYSYRSLDSIQYHYGYSYFDENGNRIPADEEDTYVGDKFIHVLGSKHNPYLIYDVVSYNTYFKDKFNTELSDIDKREYYRFVADIDFDFENISTSSKTLFGYIEGNGMTVKNITLTYVSGNQETIGFGLFSQSLFSIVNNLNLEVIEIASSAHTYVGGLVGWARTDVQESLVTGDDDNTYTSATFNGRVVQDYDNIPTYLRKNYFNNIVVYKKDDTKLENVGLVLGRNLVGGLVGYMTGYSKANNIDTSVNVNAAYVLSPDVKGKYLTYQNVSTDAEVTELSATNVFGPLTKPNAEGTPVAYTKADWTYFINRQLSYAGMAFGVVDVDINATDNANREGFSVYDILVDGEFTGAGGVIGGVIGLLAKDNIAYNINVKVVKEQSIRGSLYTGGLIGENRGLIKSSTIEYEDDKKNNNVTLVTSTRENTTFFNNNASTRAIGGIVGFNNGGKITSVISHIDVRNSMATIAGGAVGRSIMGEYSHVIVSGSVRAKTIMGGFTGTSNTTFSYLGEDGIGVVAQKSAYPNDNSSEATVTAAAISGSVKNDKYTSCIAANNWQLDDYPFLTEKEAIKRVAGGFIGSEALSPDYYVNIGNEDPYTNIMKIHSDISKSFYTNSLYYGSAGHTVAPSFYMPIAYITDFDSVTLYTEKATDGNQIFPYMYPFAATNTIDGATTSAFTLVGLTHYQIAYGFADKYESEAISISPTTPIVAGSTNVTITLTLNYESNIEEGNLYKTTVAKIYGGRKASTKTVSGGVTTYKYQYKMTATELLSGENGYTFSQKVKPDGVTVESREFGVIEKFFVYGDFVVSNDFAIGDNFYGTTEDDTYTVYPKVHIKSSSLDWINYAGTEFNEDSDGYYLIENEIDLATLAKLVNDNANDSKGGKYRDSSHKYKLTSDLGLDLSGKFWTPIGTATYPFEGLFEGDYRTIANPNMSLDGEYKAGLFGHIKGATVRNLTVTGGSIIGVTSGSNTCTAGGIVGLAENSTIDNCINENSVTGDAIVGGVVGYAIGSTITNSYNRGKITLTSASKDAYAGGIVGYATTTTIEYEEGATFKSVANTGDIVESSDKTSYSATTKVIGRCFVGGIAGKHELGSTEIADFIYNKGNITVTSNSHEIYVGGAFGYLINESGATGYVVSNIRNNGDIAVYDANIFSVNSSTEYKSTGDTKLATVGVGGVIGKMVVEYDQKIGLISNNGSVLFDNQMTSRSISGVGGLVGVIESTFNRSVTTLEQSYNTADIEVKVNSGDINIAIGIGGILGQHSAALASLASRVDIDNCYNMGDISSSGMGRVLSGGIYGVSAVRNSEGSSSANANGTYGVGNDLLANGADITGSYAYLSNSYNIGSVTGSSSNSYGLGALLGYEVGAQCLKFGETYGKNYYLAGCASYPYAKMTKTQQTNEAGEVETIETITTGISVLNSCEQKTTNTLKLYIADAAAYNNVGISFIGYDTNWEQKVSTWYPTLKNNYETLMWDDNNSPLSVQSQDFTIDNAEQLAYLSYAVNNGILDTTNVQFKLTNNIDMSNRYFTPIGNKTYPFKGIFNGDGYSINNITIDPNSALTIMDNGIAESVGALFGYVDGGTIKNTGLVSPIIKNVDYAAGFAYKFTNTSHMEYCYTDNYEISDPDVAKAEILTADRFKEGLISGKKEASGFVHTMDNSSINAGYINVPIATNPVVDTTFRPSLAGFVVNSIASTITNCYVAEGVDGSANPMFTYNTYNNTGAIFNKFVLNSVSAEGEPIESVSYCYNLGSGIVNYITRTYDNTIHDYKTDITKNDIPDSMVSTGVGPSGGGDTDSYTLQQEGWDVIDIWSYEYSLLGDISDPDETTLSATIRGLGQNWYNTECEDLILKNNVGTLITNRNEETDQGTAQYYIYYEITTPEELAWVARMVNNGKIDSKDASGNLYVFKLMNDIDLLGKYWTPIGTMDYPFSSKFDFNGYTISNLVIDCNDMSFGGLFGYTQDAEIIGGFMNNVYINIDITSEEYNSLTSVKGLYIGALIGKGNNTKVSNIEVTGNIVGYSKYNSYVGGLAGNLTFAKSSQTGTPQDYKVDNVKVKVIYGTEVLIPEDYRKSNGFGIDEIITEATESEKLMVNIAGFSLTGNSYAGGVLGYVSGKYTISYTTEAWVEQVYNEAVVVSYAKSDISRSYGGGIVGFMTENTHLNIAQNIGSVKSATYGYDYIGGVAGIIDGGSEITNVVNKGYIECSQFASVISYSGGVAGYIRGGSTATTSANLGTSFKNIDSTKIFSAGAFGYVEKDATGALPTVYNVVYSDLYFAYEDQDGNSIGYYGDGELVAEEGVITVALISTLQDDVVKDIFIAPTWNPVSGDVAYSSVYQITYDGTVSVYMQTDPEATTYTSIGSGANVAMGVTIVIKVTNANADYIIVNNRRYTLTHIVSGSGTVTISEAPEGGAGANCIVIKQLANGIANIKAEEAAS